jgi:glyoxylase-like metal-dependent hydrolase (beta-lactamase superfamily II)
VKNTREPAQDQALTPIDLEFLGFDRVIASCLVRTRQGVALIDPGPSSSLPVLRSRLKDKSVAIADIDEILLTHIHLDHAGATGTLVHENPKIRVFVHTKGAEHLIAPDRLLRSAERLYGDQMHPLWGEFLPVAPSSIHSLDGGEQVVAGGVKFEVLYTPGHASHHVSYLDTVRGVFFVGDTAGIRISNGHVLPATPPPDIDLELWNRSLDNIADRRPESLFLTHFASSQETDRHISDLREALAKWSALVGESLLGDRSDELLARTFSTSISSWMRQEMSSSDATRYRRAAATDLSWYGLARYWRKLRQSKCPTT